MLRATQAFGAGRSPSRTTGGSRRLDTERLGDHLDRLYQAALVLTRSRADAEDLVQETYAQVLRRPRLLRSDDDLPYLLRTLRNTWHRMARAARERPEPLDLMELEWALVDQRPRDPYLAAELRELLEVVSRLPDSYRDTVVAVDIVGLSYREAAKALRTREGTIMSRLFRGRAQVAEVLDPPSGR